MAAQQQQQQEEFSALVMGRKIQCIGRYAMEGHTLGKGNFARVELAHHTVTGCKVCRFRSKFPPLFKK